MKVEDFWLNCGEYDNDLVCPSCYGDISFPNGTTIPQLIELARKHIAEAHVEVLDGEVIEQPLAITR